MIQVESTFSGGVFWTNSSIVQFVYENDAFVLQNAWPFDASNVTTSRIRRVEFCKVPVLYLHNGTVLMLKHTT